MTYFKVDNNIKNLRPAIIQHSDVSLVAWTMVTNITSLSTPSHRCLLLIIRTKHGSVIVVYVTYAWSNSYKPLEFEIGINNFLPGFESVIFGIYESVALLLQPHHEGLFRSGCLNFKNRASYI
jgi:hypothetical protein